MRIGPDQSIHERVAILEEALAKCLDRDETMSVEPYEQNKTSLCVWVQKSPWRDERRGHDLHEIARELERSLS